MKIALNNLRAELSTISKEFGGDGLLPGFNESGREIALTSQSLGKAVADSKNFTHRIGGGIFSQPEEKLAKGTYKIAVAAIKDKDSGRVTTYFRLVK